MKKQWRVLLLLKRSLLDIYRTRERMHIHEAGFASRILSHPQMPGNVAERHKTHEDTVQLCKEVLDYRKDFLHWTCLMREELRRPIQNVDLVVTVGGDGTLLQASHFLDNSIPILGVNSDPTRTSEVEEKLELYDATRSIGHLCGATADTFEQVLDEVLEQRREPSELSRISTRVDGAEVATLALNDVLVAHPNPAAVSRFRFSISNANAFDHPMTMPVHVRSSGIRICTGAGSTAAMQSAGGYPMSPLSPNLQYMVREPILPHRRFQDHLRGWVRPKEVLQVRWGCRRGAIYFDGSHVFQEIQFGTGVEISSSAPSLKIFLQPDRLEHK